MLHLSQKLGTWKSSTSGTPTGGFTKIKTSSPIYFLKPINKIGRDSHRSNHMHEIIRKGFFEMAKGAWP
ncbi:MAG: hypothetical protein OEL81_08170 [Nitrosopumilus sp.]|nr:hypothetical protein [Nitrosopumilus sp.]